MQLSRGYLLPVLFLVLVALATLFPPVCAGSSPALSPADNPSAAQMQVAIYVNSIDNLDMVTGTYTVDYYLHFRWTDPRITDPHFEIMNGEPASGTGSVALLSEDTNGPVKDLWYRVRADFRIVPNNLDYPFESGTLPIILEDTRYNNSEMVYVPLTRDSGMDPGFGIPGWKLGTPTFTVTAQTYPWNDTYSRLSFNIPITNDAAASLVQTIVPPLLFCIIAALSFFIDVKHNELVHLRYVLVTSMFISAVMYHFSQIALVPGLGVLKIFDKFMIAVYLFLAVTIMVTTLCYLAQQQWNRPGLVRPLNRYGVVASIVLPVILFLLLVKLV